MKRLVSLGVMVALGCASTAGAAAPQPPRRAAASRVLLDPASGMRFPARVGGAVRLASDPTDVQDGYTIVRYRIPIREGGSAVVRIGIVHIEQMTAREHYDTYRPQILARLPGGAVRSEEKIAIPGAVGDSWHGSFVGSESASGLITADFGYWSARLISSYPLASADEAQIAIKAFVDRLDWKPLLAQAPRER